ncbi:MAG TPA: bL35 family ribosomal protein [Nocardioidaceae bacterium]|nr:bL35 family ribosomal protein [Nocardioidaceae bacterium]
MPKNKTHSGASKRVKTTSTGKLRRLQAGRKAGAAFASTPLRGRKHRRRHTGTVDVAASDTKRLKKMLGR